MLTNPGATFCQLDEIDTRNMEGELIFHGKVENVFENNTQPDFSPSCYLNTQMEINCLY